MFSQAFTATYGDTPRHYVIKGRIKRSKHPLIGTDLSIAGVAPRAGFSSQNHLSDLFKRVTGETLRNHRHAAARA